MYNWRRLLLILADTERRREIEPAKDWTGGYQWQNHLWKELLPFDREKMKGEDKKWLLIDGCFICLNPDDQTMQSNLVQKGAKVLMGFQSTLLSFVQFISSQFGIRHYTYCTSCLFLLCDLTGRLKLYGITEIEKPSSLVNLEKWIG